MSGYDEKLWERLEAICALAASNFPGNTDLRISANGEATGAVCIPSHMIAELLKLRKEK